MLTAAGQSMPQTFSKCDKDPAILIYRRATQVTEDVCAEDCTMVLNEGFLGTTKTLSE